ncbi:MAG TPA: MEDS domain-containing protein [Gammaproteobacteria bacterium]|nr:MEDS domain-containing protein [Gammaproteobacteria bacterium]
MSNNNLPYITRLGLPGIDRVPFGFHACHFYSSRDQLIATLVPYFIAGLRNNERCHWITAHPLPARDAIEVLCAAWNGVNNAMQAGALSILDFEQWYESSAGLNRDVLKLWIEEEERALADGYTGLRITGNLSFLKPQDWTAFMQYEQAVTSRFNGGALSRSAAIRSGSATTGR